MWRLKIAERELRSFMSDVRDLRPCQPHEVVALAKIREALALIQEADLLVGRMEYLPMMLVAMDLKAAEKRNR